MRSLPEEWDLKTTITRDNTSLDDVSLDEIYGRLETLDLEIQQRKNRKSTKVKPIALNMKTKSDVRTSSSPRRKARYDESCESTLTETLTVIHQKLK